MRRIFPNLHTTFRSGCRSATQFALTVMILFFTLSTTAETTNTLSDAEIQGRQLAQKICEQQPITNSVVLGILNIRNANGYRTNYSVEFSVVIQTTNWTSKYTSDSVKPATENLLVVHARDCANVYSHFWSSVVSRSILPNDEFSPFAKSDFWLCDLGLEFFHWPQQKVLKKEVHRSCGCTVLESTNPNPSTNGYSRVVSWIDTESLGIVEAYAYDAKGKLLKDFYPKDIKKVNGRWQVQTLVMENVQTDSRSRLEFDLKK